MSGPSSQQKQQQQSNISSLSSMGQGAAGASAEDRAKMSSLMAPVTGFTSSILAGDKGAWGIAAAPNVASTTAQFATAKTNLENNPLMSGAGKEAAFSSLEGQRAGAISSYLNNAYTGALGTQANIAQGYGGLGVQNLQAGTGALGTSSTANAQLMNAQAQGVSSWLNPLASVVGGGIGGWLGQH